MLIKSSLFRHYFSDTTPRIAKRNVRALLGSSAVNEHTAECDDWVDASTDVIHNKGKVRPEVMTSYERDPDNLLNLNFTIPLNFH